MGVMFIVFAIACSKLLNEIGIENADWYVALFCVDLDVLKFMANPNHTIVCCTPVKYNH
jgi:hypothetical protein